MEPVSLGSALSSRPDADTHDGTAEHAVVKRLPQRRTTDDERLADQHRSAAADDASAA
jgi:hypothetical protein